jgi:pyridoxamine 5'-phosphate oxidase
MTEHNDPLVFFDRWFEVAREEGDDEMPEACCLATIDPDGYPDARMVLLKERDARGFVFHTNYHSVKGRSLEAVPRAALVFHWEKLHRQVRVQGDVERLSAAESDEYFATRARGSQIGAWASDQSKDMKSDDVLRARTREIEERFAGRPVTRPPHWGGLRIAPERIEFWHGRADRLHERTVYVRDGDGWRASRLFP